MNSNVAQRWKTRFLIGRLRGPTSVATNHKKQLFLPQALGTLK